MLIHSIEKLPSDIQNIIGDFLCNKSKCRFHSTIVNKSSIMLDLKYLTNIKIVDKNEGKFLTDEILLQPKFLQLTKLNVKNHQKITNLNRFKKLTEINIGNDCGVDDAGICELENLLIINADCNKKITNLNQFKKLTEINFCGVYCGVNDYGICELENLLIIDAENNTKITNLNRFKKLTKINIDGYCGVDDVGICELSSSTKSRGAVDNLLIINSYSNEKITNLNRFKKLTEINITWNCGVDDVGICELENLLIINAFDNQKITNLNRFKKLTEINIGFDCGVDDIGICELSSSTKSRGAVDNLLIINADGNPKIKNLNRFKKLTEIYISGDCGVNDAGICELENLLIINAYSNYKITNLNRFKKLTEIDISISDYNNCKVNDAGIYELENLLIINAFGNPKITNLNRFKKLTEINIGHSCGVNYAGICELDNLLIIKADGNTKITNLVRSTAYATRFKKLTEIDISYNCGFNDAVIFELSSSTKSRGAVENLLIINASENPKIIKNKEISSQNNCSFFEWLFGY
jgi:hypothetical protein